MKVSFILACALFLVYASASSSLQPQAEADSFGDVVALQQRPDQKRFIRRAFRRVKRAVKRKARRVKRRVKRSFRKIKRKATKITRKVKKIGNKIGGAVSKGFTKISNSVKKGFNSFKKKLMEKFHFVKKVKHFLKAIKSKLRTVRKWGKQGLRWIKKRWNAVQKKAKALTSLASDIAKCRKFVKNSLKVATGSKSAGRSILACVKPYEKKIKQLLSSGTGSGLKKRGWVPRSFQLGVGASGAYGLSISVEAGGVLSWSPRWAVGGFIELAVGGFGVGAEAHVTAGLSSSPAADFGGWAWGFGVDVKSKIGAGASVAWNIPDDGSKFSFSDHFDGFTVNVGGGVKASAGIGVGYTFSASTKK